MTQRWIDLATAAEILDAYGEEAILILLRARVGFRSREGMNGPERVYDARAVEELAKVRAAREAAR